MGLDDELCRKAKELYGWDMRFEGEPFDLCQVQSISEQRWLAGSPNPHLKIGLLKQGRDMRYGFVCDSNVLEPPYQPIARIHRDRKENYQEDFLRVLCAHLRIDVVGQATIKLPEEFAQYIRGEHIKIISRPERDPQRLGIGEALIYGPIGRREALGQLSLFEPS